MCLCRHTPQTGKDSDWSVDSDHARTEQQRVVLTISIYHGLQMRAREAGFKLCVDHTAERPLTQ
eukprot:134408-Pleurochrysis_carterae.AAC.1